MKVIIFLISLMVALSAVNISHAMDIENTISIDGEARFITTPDIAHCFLKVDGEGASYELSNKAARNKIGNLKDILKTIFGKVPDIREIKITNQPKGEALDDMYGKEFITGMAKAIKGEEPVEKDKPKEMATTINVYFKLPTFTEENILSLLSMLSEKEIAFDKKNPFDFSIEYFSTDKSAIFFGLENFNIHLESLAAEAFKKARGQAEIIAKAANKKLGNLINISGCGGGLGGTVNFSGADFIGEDMGPLSSDPKRLSIKFSKTFTFQIQ